MSNSRFSWLLVSMFFVYTQGLWERVFSLPAGAQLFLELPLWIYLAMSFKNITKPTPAIYIVTVFTFFTLFASIVNQTPLLSWVKYIRFLLYFYFIYASLWQSQIRPKQWILLMKFSIFLVLIQGIGSAFNIFVLGQRVEGHVGLMSSLGGTTASTFPLVIISTVAILYFFSKKNGVKWILFFLLLVVSAALVGYGSGKRAIFFSIPLFLIVTIVISYYNFKGKSVFFKKIAGLIFFVVVAIPFYIFGMTTSEGIENSLQGNESRYEILKEAFTYAQSYEESTSQKGETTGRSGTTQQVIFNSVQSYNSFLFGNGFGSVKDENMQSSMGVMYGIVGITRDIISGGWIVMILTILIISRIMLINRSSKFGVTRVLRLILFLIFLFTHITYSSDFVVSLKIDFLLVLLLVFINGPRNEQYLNSVITRYFYSG